MSAEQSAPAPIGWAILELMGHRKLGGFVSEETLAGAAFVRIDVPGPERPDDGDPFGEKTLATQFYSPAAVYCVTPTTEEVARALAAALQPAPVARYELAPVAASSRASDDVDDADLGVEPPF
jgi:hypothetical protein